LEIAGWGAETGCPGGAGCAKAVSTPNVRAKGTALTNDLIFKSFLEKGFSQISSALTLQMLVAFAVVTASLFNPLQSAVCIICFVGVVLIEAGVHTRLTCRLT
jgi:hypothetical protein